MLKKPQSHCLLSTCYQQQAGAQILMQELVIPALMFYGFC